MTLAHGRWLALAVAVAATPAEAQDHGGHGSHSAHQASPAPTPEPTLPPVQADPHAGHQMADPHAGHAMPAPPSPPSPPAGAPSVETPPPPGAGSGPPRAADAIWGAEAMRASRRALQQVHGDYPLFWFQVDRAEVQMRDGRDGYLWDIQGYYGGPTERLWFKSEGEGAFGAAPDDAEVQALYARAIAPFFDVQAGIRHDIAGPDTTHAVVGIQGLAPYLFEIDAALFLSHRGDLTARIEAELDQRITQRLIVQPRIEANLAAQDIPMLGVGAGLDHFDFGVRLRYEFVREFAPYIGVEQSWRTGRGADFARAAGTDPSVTQFVAGIRLWF